MHRDHSRNDARYSQPSHRHPETPRTIRAAAAAGKAHRNPLQSPARARSQVAVCQGACGRAIPGRSCPLHQAAADSYYSQIAAQTCRRCIAGNFQWIRDPFFR